MVRQIPRRDVLFASEDANFYTTETFHNQADSLFRGEIEGHIRRGLRCRAADVTVDAEDMANGVIGRVLARFDWSALASENSSAEARYNVFRAYILKAARNAVIDVWRARYRRPLIISGVEVDRMGAGDVEPGSRIGRSRSLTPSALRALIAHPQFANLDPITQSIIRRRAACDAYQEIADGLGGTISANAARVRYHRAVRVLQHAMQANASNRLEKHP